MFGELVTAYLFLAGVGAGGVAAASVADLLFVREPFGADVVPDFAEKRPAERLVAGVLALSALSAASCGCALLMAGALFVEGDGSVRKAVRSAARVDVVVIVAEVVAAAGLLAFALGSDHAGVRA